MNTPQWYYQLIRPCPHHQNFISTSLILPEIADVTKTCLMWYEMRHVESTKRMPFFRGQKMPNILHSAIRIPRGKTPYFLGSCVTFHNTHSAAFPTTLGGKKQIPGPQIVYLHFGSPWFETVSNGPRWLYQDQLWCGEMPWSDRQNVWPTSVLEFHKTDCDWIQNALKEKNKASRFCKHFQMYFQKGAGRWSNMIYPHSITPEAFTTASRASSTVVAIVNIIYLYLICKDQTSTSTLYIRGICMHLL